MADLTSMVCKPCNNLTPRLTAEQIEELSRQVSGWEIKDGKKLFKRWKFENFVDSLRFANTIGEIAEEEGHHPDVALGWGYAEVTSSTHAIGGLSENDFILASKIDASITQ